MLTIKEKCREDFKIYIRSKLIKGKCEMCGCEENLIVHHTIRFIDLFNETVEEIGLNNEELFRNVMLAKQIKSKLITLCPKCHKNIHKEIHGGFSQGNKGNVDWEDIKKKRRIEKDIKRKEYGENVVKPYLQQIYNNNEIFLTRKDREPLIEIIGIIDSNNSNLKEGTIKYVKNINSLNGYLEEINSQYRIKQFETSRIINGNKKKFKSAWKIIKL